MIHPAWTRAQRDQLTEQLEQQQAEAQRLQQELTEEQKIRATSEMTLAQATIFLQDILQVGSRKQQEGVEVRKLFSKSMATWKRPGWARLRGPSLP